MPFGCFGKRKKKDKSKTSPSKAPNANSTANDSVAKEAVVNETVAKETVAKAESPPVAEVKEEMVTVARAQSLHAAAPPSSVQQRGPGGNIQKSATLARYDFLKKSEYENSADRWAALKQQYLAPKMSQSSHPSGNSQPPRPRRIAQSLPRQFSPPSTVVSAVKFSQWFYDRQIKEEEARQEAHEREEKTRKLLEGVTESEMEAAAARIQAGFKGYKTRQLQQQLQQQQAAEVEEPANEEAPASATEAPSQEQPQLEQQQGQQQEQQQEEQQQENQNEEEELDLNDPQLNEAALKIQAGFKGMQVRKELQEQQQNDQNEQNDHNEQSEQNEQKGDQQQQQETDSEDMTEMNAAAARIQAGFKGYKTRKEMGLMDHREDKPEAEEAAS